jgi:hypothetical protein
MTYELGKSYTLEALVGSFPYVYAYSKVTAFYKITIVDEGRLCSDGIYAT